MIPTHPDPLIQFHGVVHTDFMSLAISIPLKLKEKIPDKDHDLVFSEISPFDEGVDEKLRPFIVVYDSDCFLIHHIVEILRDFNWKGEVFFKKVDYYFDLRKN